MDIQLRKKFVKKWLHSIWELFEVENLKDFYDQEVIGHYNAKEITSEDLRRKIDHLAKHTKGASVEVIHLLIEGEKFAVHANQKFTLEDDSEFLVPSLYFGHFKNGKIYRYWIKTYRPFDFEPSDNPEEMPHKP